MHYVLQDTLQIEIQNRFVWDFFALFVQLMLIPSVSLQINTYLQVLYLVVHSS